MFSDFNCEMCSMRINGIYESQVPLLFKAIVELGINCRLDSVKNSLNISLEQLHMVCILYLLLFCLLNFFIMFYKNICYVLFVIFFNF